MMAIRTAPVGLEWQGDTLPPNGGFRAIINGREYTHLEVFKVAELYEKLQTTLAAIQAQHPDKSLDDIIYVAVRIGVKVE